MALFSKRLFDFVHWDGPIGVLAHRDAEPNLRKFSKLQVTEAQEALVIVNGERSQKFGPGQYNLDSPNVPILSEFYGLPFRDGENPWTVQVWFVNKTMPVNFDWTTDAFNIYDHNFSSSIPIYAQGRYGITVVDIERFILKLCLGFPVTPDGVNVTEKDITDQMQGMLVANTKGLISQVISANRIGINDISARLIQVADLLKPNIQKFFEDYGCKVTEFYVTTIDIDTGTEDGQRIRQAITSQSAQRISGHSWQQEQIFSTARDAINNMGSGGSGGLLGAVLATQMMGGTGGGMGGAVMQPPAMGSQPGPQQGGAQPYAGGFGGAQPNFGGQGGFGGQPGFGGPQPRYSHPVYCANCSRRFDGAQDFCPNCGKRYNPCPRCAADNAADARRCVQCGTPFADAQQTAQPMGGQPIGAVFCTRCGAQAAPGQKFCSSCGNKL